MKEYNPVERFQAVTAELEQLIKQFNQYNQVANELRTEITARNGILRELQPYVEEAKAAADENKEDDKESDKAEAFVN